MHEQGFDGVGVSVTSACLPLAYPFLQMIMRPVVDSVQIEKELGISPSSQKLLPKSESKHCKLLYSKGVDDY